MDFIASMIPVITGTVLGWVGVLIGDRRRDTRDRRDNLRNAYSSWFTAYRIVMLRLQILRSLIQRSIDDREEYQSAISELREVLPPLEDLLKSHHSVLLLERSDSMRGMVRDGADTVANLYSSVSDQLLEVRENVRLLERLERMRLKARELDPLQSGYAEAMGNLREIEVQVKERHQRLLNILAEGNEEINKISSDLVRASTSIASLLGKRPGLWGRVTARFNL